jgi:Ni/Fe-hydrogenase subunit HybB-like protein
MSIQIILLGILAILAIAGIVAILHQLKDGFKKTNLNDQYVWGIYIQGYFPASYFKILW